MAIRPQREKSCQLSAVSYQPDSKVKSVSSPNFACFASSRETSSLLLTLCALRHALCSNRSAKICENLRLINPIALRYAPCALPFPVCANLRKSAVKSPIIVRDGASFVCRPLPTNKNSNFLRLCGESLKESFSSLNLASLASLRSPRGVRPWGSYSACVEINTPQGEASFLHLPLCALRHALCGYQSA